MKFVASKTALVKALQCVIGVVEKRQTLPILSNVLLDLNRDTLKLTGTDMELQLVTTLAVDSESTGKITVNARKLYDICRSLPDECDLTIQVTDKGMQVNAGRNRFSLAVLSANDFPHMAVQASSYEVRLPANDLKALIAKTHFAMAHQDVRYYLNGLLLELRSDSLRVVATDGHRLAYAEKTFNEGTGLEEGTVQAIIVPRKTISELLRQMEDSDASINIQLSTQQLVLQLPDITFTSKLIDGRFPDYERVIPANHPKLVTVSREELKSGLTRAAILSNEKFKGVRFCFNTGQITLESQNPEQEEAKIELEAEFNDQPFEIGFNISYVQEALGVMNTERVQILLNSSDQSGLLQEQNDEGGAMITKYVIMPMRL